MNVEVIGQMDNAMDNTFESANRVYDSNGISPTINTCGGGDRQPKILEVKALRMVRTEEGKKPRKSYESGEIHHGFNEHRVAEPREDGLSNTITTVQKDNMVLEQKIVAMRGRNPDNPSDRNAGAPTEQRLEIQSDGICNTLTSVQKDNFVLEKKMIIQNPHGFNEGKTIHSICPTITSHSFQENNFVLEVLKGIDEKFHKFLYLIDGDLYLIRIRKLTPLECWRLMDFSDEDYEKAAYEIKDVKEEFLCYAKSRGVIERLSQSDTETYVLNITNALAEQAATLTAWTKYQNKQESESNPNVNIVIEKSGGMGHSECAVNITKCLENTETLCTLKTELDQHHTAIIEWERRGKPNTARYMRVTSEENLSLPRLYTILTVIGLIMQSTIYTSILHRVNIRGRIVNSVDLSINMVAKISDLKMDAIYTRVSASQLYRQAGNSIVVNALKGIFGQMIDGKESRYKEA